MERPYFPKRAIVTAGMPYGNKGLHFGHIAGVFVPADAYARFLRDRIGRDNVMFVSGTDCYGSPIDEGYRKLREAGEFEGSIEEYVSSNHVKQKDALDAYHISLDIYEGSGLGSSKPIHANMSEYFITQLYENGYLEKRSTAQFFDVTANTFLNGRQVVGHCPVQGCKSEKGYADECDLGHQYMPEDLIAPKSTITGEVPEMRAVTNWYFKLPEFTGLLREFVADISTKDTVRSVVPTTINEFLSAPVIYVKNELRDEYEALKEGLPLHTFREAEKGKASFELEFETI
ncbi:MAG: class I tRNA ligase family protein, partial [Actinobacteria bacterium]|nr:class I tRNA ligase family protein [Actinomycetota bacterium]